MRGRRRGYSLVEVLVTLTVVSCAFLLLIGAFAPAGKGVQWLRHRVTAQGLARDQMEMVHSAAYRANPTAAPYPTLSASAPYSVTISVGYWITATDTFASSVPAQDGGLQQITVSVSRPGESTFVLQDYKGER